MARFNKIFAGPANEVAPQVREALAAVDLIPGSLAVINAAGAMAYATATTVGKVLIVQDDYLTMGGPTKVIKVGNTAMGLEMLTNLLFHVRVANSSDLKVGTELSPAAAGTLAIAATGDLVVATSEEVYNNNTGAVQLVLVRPATTSYIKP